MRANVAALPLLVPLALALGGCGSSKQLPPAVEPPVSPPLKLKPPGKIVELGNEPEGLVIDPKTELVAVGLRNPDRLGLVDARGGRLRRYVRLSESPRHLSLARDGGLVLVPAERSNELIEVALPSGDSTSVKVGNFPHDAVAVGNRVFIGNEMQDTLSIVENGKTIRTIPAPIQPGGLAATPSGQVAVVAVRERVIRTYDALSLKPLKTVTGGVGPSHVVADGSQRLYVADTGGNAILAYRVDGPLRFVDRVNLSAAPYGLAVDERRHLLWVTEPARNRLVELRIPRYQGAVRLVQSYATVRQPNTVAVDPSSGRVFIAGRKDGVLQILDPKPPA